MPGELFAVAAAFCFGSNYILAKRGLRSASVEAGVLVSLCGAVAVLVLAALIGGAREITADAAVTFACVGVAASGVGTWASIVGVDRLGPSSSVPVETGARPIAAVALAILFLDERLTAAQGVGIAAIVAGGMVLARLLAGENVNDGTRSVGRAALFPLVAGVSYAAGDVASRSALEDSSAVLGAAINLGAALLFWLIVAFGVPRVRGTLRFGAVPTFAGGGVLLGVALLSLYRALDATEVSIVAPLIAAQPLAVLLLSLVLLRGVERLRWVMVGPGVLVVIGTAFIVA